MKIQSKANIHLANAEEINDSKISKKFSFGDFKIEKMIGKGSFGKVFLVTSKSNLTSVYAMKTVKKGQVLENDDLDSVINERDTCKLGNKNHFLTKLFGSFQNEVKYFSYSLTKYILIFTDILRLNSFLC